MCPIHENLREDVSGARKAIRFLYYSPAFLLRQHSGNLEGSCYCHTGYGNTGIWQIQVKTLCIKAISVYILKMDMEFEDILQTFPAASDYLSAIYLINRDHGHVSNSKLADWLDVSRPAVSQAVNRLKKLDLITQERYSHIQMTERGSRFAVKMLRRHYLLEHFLMDHLGFTWDEIDIEAKRLQNNISDIFEERMFKALGKPQTCPHGNPIPGTDDEEKILAYPQISGAEEGESGIFSRITEEGEEKEGLLKYIHEHEIHLGDRFTVKSRKEDGLLVDFQRQDNVQSMEEIVLPREFCDYLCYSPA